jgi:hypothetical protein
MKSMKLMILNGPCYFACSNCPQGSNIKIMKRNLMNCTGIFRTPEFAILAFDIAA